MAGNGNSEWRRAQPIKIPRGKLAVMLLLGALVVAGSLLALPDASHRTLWLHRRRLNAIVSRIKASHCQIGKLLLFTVDRSLDVDTVRSCDADHCDPARSYIISVSVIRKDDYLIEFPVDNRGHSGEFGIIYSDSPPKTVNLGDYRGAEYTSCLSVIIGRYDRNWWYARDLGS